MPKPPTPDLTHRHTACAYYFAVGMLAAVALALAFRLPRLEPRPMHCDEANQAYRAGLLHDRGEYVYDTFEHHGPSIYWLTLPSLWLSRTPDYAASSATVYRIVPVLFGVGLLGLLLLVRDGLGRRPTLVAAVLTALSPAMVFYSRYYIQEMLLVFFTLAAVACGWRYARTRRLGWAAATGAALGMMHATKETWILAAAAMVFALVMTAAWSRWRDGRLPTLKAYVPLWPIGTGIFVAAVVAVVFYSSFGRNPNGPLDSILAYGNYWHRGSKTGIHTHPWFWYLELVAAFRPARGFFWSEGLIVGLAAVGALFSLSLRERAGVRGTTDNASSAHSPHPGPLPEGEGDLGFLRFLAFYTVTLTFLYAAIPYKTPWCLLSFFDAMILLAGVGAASIVRWLPGRGAKLVVAGLLAAAAVQLGWQSYLLNFRFDNDPRNPYVYAQTVGDVQNLTARLQRLAEASGVGRAMTIHVVTPQNFWPLPWYLRRFAADRIGYWPDPADWAKTRGGRPPDVILLTPDVQAAVDACLRGNYNTQMIFGLRRDVLVLAYVRADLWAALLDAEGKAR